MAIHKLLINDFISEDYELIAIHSTLEDYRLAYFINQKLPVTFEKSSKDIGIQVPEGHSHFTRFIFDDEAHELFWNLIPNKTTLVTRQTKATSLFEETEFDMATNIFLLPELKKVDYIIKIENTDDFFDLDQLIDELLTIKQITMAYKIEQNKLKSKNNLIF
ncbi:IPExxxVDY family protein [Flavobacterium cerinum]|uniref:IPExxxVDY family protein n=1 Tax=Flavobacterium cerinum TaxID=2502784 RepID=A0ABY5IUS6_9FLAO|nr:IPExxxVDY family protein [Flavobacterium cerinum]UUC46121.1 IPExxxVDY family protein [Flavobacterium cerinum]